MTTAAYYVASGVWLLGAIIGTIATIASLRDITDRREEVNRMRNGRKDMRLAVLNTDRRDELAALMLHVFFLLIGLRSLTTVDEGGGYGRLVIAAVFIFVQYVQVSRTVSKRRERNELRADVETYLASQRPTPAGREESP